MSCVCKTMKDVWEPLQTVFEDTGVNKRCRLSGKSVSISASTVQLYSSKVMPTSQKLTDVVKETDNEMLTVLLLQGLTRQYSPY